MADPNSEAVQFYKVSGLKVIAWERAEYEPPPWRGVPPALEIYRERGHRRLDARTYATSCQCCIWGALMPVEMIIDQWKPSKKKYRQETWCYGPKSCRLYKGGDEEGTRPQRDDVRGGGVGGGHIGRCAWPV